MLLSVVVVNWNSRDDLVACLESLQAQTVQDIEVVVVDNGSTDGSAQAVRDRFPAVRLLAEQTNLGFAEACNRGIDASSAPWVAMLNNDAVATPNWAEALLAAADRAPLRCGMLQALMLFMGMDDVVNSTGVELTPRGGRDRHEHRRRSDLPPARDVFCPTAGAAAYRRSMLDAIRLPTGYFDRTHFMYYEDLDLGWRARLAGWSAEFVPDAVVHHRYHGSTRRQGRSWLVQLIRTNRLRTMLKNASWRFILKTAPRTTFQMVEVLWHGRLAAPARIADAIVQGVRHRRIVTAMATLSRADTESQWVKK